MTNNQRAAAAKLSKARQALLEMNQDRGDTWSDDKRARYDRLEQALGDAEREYRASLIVSEPAGEPPARARLERRISLHKYMASAIAGSSLAGAEAELNKELRLDGSWVPLHAFDEPPEQVEQRADTHTGAPSDVSRSGPAIMPRIFAGSLMSSLGVAMPRVPAGERQYVVLTAGVTGAARARGARIDSVAATFTTTELKPKRLAARYTFSLESASELVGMEQALRKDIMSAIRYKQEQDLLYGAGGANSIGGFLSATASTGLPGAAGAFDRSASAGASNFDGLVGLLGAGLDGLHAERYSDLSFLLGADTATLAAGTFRQNTSDAALDYLMSRAGSLRVSSHIAAAASNAQGGLLYRKRAVGGMKSVMPVWNAVQLIRDPYTDSASGVVGLTVHLLFNFAIIRSAAYNRLAFHIA